jgi:hypothetical protein
MKRLTVKITLHCLALAILASAVARPGSAQTSTVLDPLGDAVSKTSKTSSPPAFQDIVMAQMTKTASGDFELLMGMAGPVPVAPPLPRHGVREIWWAWFFDLDPTAFPSGYPLPPGFAPPPQGNVGGSEFLVYVGWDGTEFTGIAIDRRPLLAGGEPVITPIPFSISGTLVQASLASTLIGGVPASFGWHVATRDWSGRVGSLGWHAPDFAGAVFP